MRIIVKTGVACFFAALPPDAAADHFRWGIYMPRRRLLFWYAHLFCFCAATQPLYSATGLTFDASAKAYFWTPGEINGLSFETEGLRSWAVGMALGSKTTERKTDSFQIVYEAPLDASDSFQREMLSVNKGGTEGLEKYMLGIRPDAIVFALKPAWRENGLLKALLSTEFKYSRSLFYGKASVSAPCFYLDSGVKVNWNTRTIYGGKRLGVGDAIAFRTEFMDLEISIPFYRYKDHEFRAGYFNRVWERPSDNNQSWSIATHSGVYPVIYDTAYKSRGFLFAFKSAEASSAGLNTDLSVQFGSKNEIKQALPLNLPEHEKLTAITYSAGLWYNWYPHSDGRTGFFFSLGGDVRAHGWYAEDFSASASAADGDNLRLLDKDILYSGYLRTGYRF